MEVCLSNRNSRTNLRQAGLVVGRLGPGESGVNKPAWLKDTGDSIHLRVLASSFGAGALSLSGPLHCSQGRLCALDQIALPL